MITGGRRRALVDVVVRPIPPSGRILRIAASLLAVAAVTLVLLTALAAGADASRRVALGPTSAQPFADARYYRSSVSAIQPAVPGLIVTAQGNGLVSLTNRSGKTVTVLGYTGEPYLRFSAAGVDENVNSLSAILNNAARQAIPVGTIENGNRPHWQHRDDGDTAVWHDYRARWGSAQRPANVAADPRRQQQVSGWTLQLVLADQRVLVQGVVNWTGTPRFTRHQLTILITSLLIGLAALLLLISRPAHLRWRSPDPDETLGLTG